MTDDKTESLTEKARSISKETAEALKQFSHTTALMMYAKMMEQSEGNASLIEETVRSSKQSGQKMDKMLSEARLKWKYATDSDKKKVIEMENIIQQGQERIKALYNQ